MTRTYTALPWHCALAAVVIFMLRSCLRLLFAVLAQLWLKSLAFPDRFLAIRRHVGSNLVHRHKPLSAGELS